jgi:hypothetical protein
MEIRPLVAQTHDLRDIVPFLRGFLQKHHVGKIVLRVG